MEKIQERALRFVYNNYAINYEELLHLSKLPSLKVHRLRSITKRGNIVPSSSDLGQCSCVTVSERILMFLNIY
jgi:hypothetical protein